MVHFGQVRDLARKELVEALNQYSGSKVLVWDDGLTGPMDLVAGAKFLRDREVVRMVQLKLGRLPPTASTAENIVFITRPEPELMDVVADNVKK